MEETKAHWFLKDGVQTSEHRVRRVPAPLLTGFPRSKLLRLDDSGDVIKTPAALPWLDDIALRELVLHGQHAACIDARGDVYQWGQGLVDSEASSGPTLTLRGKVCMFFDTGITLSHEFLFQNIKQLSISSSRVVALSHSGQVHILRTVGVQPVSSSSSGWGLWDSGDAGASVELTSEDKLPRGER